ncbi:MAG: dihydrofolate reductase [Treponema sp.]|nr:dihydrofolate reductase [Treponema sp.]
MIALIAARSLNNVIGKKGKIPWKIQGEQKEFKELTIGNIVIMGRKTYEEIGHPLANRKTIVLSKNQVFKAENLYSAKSVKEALDLAHTLEKSDGLKKNIFFAGGYEIYKEALPLVDTMYLTQVELTVKDGDTFFPAFNESDFEIEKGQTFGDKIKFTRNIYRRK